MLYTIPFLLLLLVVGLLHKIRISFHIHIFENESDIILNLRFLYKLFNIKIHFRAYYREGEQLEIFKLKAHNKRKTVFPVAKEGISNASLLLKSLPFKKYKEWLELSKLHLFIQLGTGDGATSALLCGLLGNIVKGLGYTLFYDNEPKITGEIIPVFDRSYCNIKMEGILYIRHTKIIFETLRLFTRFKRVSLSTASE